MPAARLAADLVSASTPLVTNPLRHPPTGLCAHPLVGVHYTNWWAWGTLTGGRAHPLVCVEKVNPIRRSVFSFGYTAPSQFFIFHFALYIPRMDSPVRYRAALYGLAYLVEAPRNPAWDAVLGEGNWVGKDGVLDGASVLDQLRQIEAQRVRQRLQATARSTSSSAWEDLLAE